MRDGGSYLFTLRTAWGDVALIRLLRSHLPPRGRLFMRNHQFNHFAKQNTIKDSNHLAQPDSFSMNRVAPGRAAVKVVCKNGTFGSKICTAMREILVDVSSVAGFWKMSSREGWILCRKFSAGRRMQESAQNGLQFLLKSCIMIAKLSFDRLRLREDGT